MRSVCKHCGGSLYGQETGGESCLKCEASRLLEGSVSPLPPTTHRPGSAEKVAVLARRYTVGMQLHFPGEHLDDVEE